MASSEDLENTFFKTRPKTPDHEHVSEYEKEKSSIDTVKLPCDLLRRKEEKTDTIPQVPDPGNPTVQQSWEQIMKTVDGLDDDLVKGYKEDIDTLLVFAGLFSAVVTAFTIESFKRLDPDPTILLLTQIAQQTSSSSSPTFQPQLFTPSSSDVRINTCLFLSLTLALVDALFGLLCKQWVREHQRQTNTQTPRQALALRWLRLQSFERWHVPTILASLPILLEVALFLFFAGLLELLWSRHHVPFALALSAVGLAISFYLVTTVLPSISIIRRALKIHPYFASNNPEFDPVDIARLPAIDLICPYKSPQSWLIFRLLSSIYHLPGCKKLLYFFVTKFNWNWTQNDGWDSIDDLDESISKNILNLSHWPSLDLNVIQRFSRIKRCPDLYELKGFRWLVQETRDIPSMIPHLKNVLAEIPGHLVMPTVFDRWDLPPGKPAWSSIDVESALDVPLNTSDYNLFDDQSSVQQSVLACQILGFRHLLVTYERYGPLAEAAKKLWRRILKEPENNRFIRAFFCHEELLFGPSKDWRARLLYFYRQHWDELDVESQVQLAYTLSNSILSFLESSEHDIGSTLLTSSFAVYFFTSVNDKLCETKEFFEQRGIIQHWMGVLSHVRRIHQLPLLYFKPIPGCFPILSNELKNLLGNSPTCEEFILEPLVDSYQERWDGVHSYQKEKLVKTLSNHINQGSAALTSMDLILSNEEPQQSIPPISAFITSQRGLQFLTFVNEGLAQESTFLSWLRLCESGTINLWVDALERVRVLRQLPSGYFKPIPKRDEETDKIVGWYQPKNPGGINTLDHDGDGEEIQDDHDASSLSKRAEGEKGDVEMFPMVSSRVNLSNVTVTQEAEYRVDGGLEVDRDVGGPGAENNV